MDFYNHYFNNHYDFLIYYLAIISIWCLCMIIQPTLITFSFILMSIFHFGEDFVYITNNKKSIALGYTLFFFTLLWDYDIWVKILFMIPNSNHKIIISILYLLFFD